MPRITDNPKQKIVSFRTEDHVLSILQDEANRRGSTLSQVVRQAFEDWLSHNTSTATSKNPKKRQAKPAPLKQQLGGIK